MKYIKGILIRIVLIFLLAIFFLSKDEYILGDRVLEYSLGDINGDSKKELIVLTKNIFSKFGRDIVIYSSKNELNELYREDFSEFNYL